MLEHAGRRAAGRGGAGPGAAPQPRPPRARARLRVGASSGGAFVAALPFFADVDGVVAQIAGVGFPRDPRSNTAFFATPAELGDALREARGTRGTRRRPRGRRAARATRRRQSRTRGGKNGDVATGKNDREAAYPPVVFSHMSRDALVGALVDESRAFLDAAGVPTRVTELAPQPVDANFFHRRVVRAAAPRATKGPGAGVRSALRTRRRWRRRCARVGSWTRKGT